VKDIPRSWIVAGVLAVAAIFVAVGYATFDQWSGLVAILLPSL
jgi:hypothetical protein